MKRAFIPVILFLLTLSCIIQQSLAVTAYPHPIQYISPDGSSLTILLNGDEKVSWAASTDGYTLLRNSENYYEYAIANENHDLVCSGVRANNINSRTVEEISFLQTLAKDLRYSSDQVTLLLNFWRIEEEIQNSAKQGGNRVVGDVRAPLILVDFQDKPFTKSQEEFEALMNQPNYSSTNDGPISGSVYDYFYETSYQQLSFQVDVYGPYTLSNNISHYDNNSSGGNSMRMAREGAEAAYNDGCDFSLYDLDNDGFVDGVHFIFAGYGQEAGAPVGSAIWSHAWSLYGGNPLYLNNKRIYRFSCSPELRSNSGGKITHIGVIAHELSHVFGLPDFYDTDGDYSGGNAMDLGTWDIMASGSWNNGGRTPANHSAWSKNYLGWVNAVTLTSPCNVTIPNPADEGASYRINTTTENEYFLLENRQKIGWDAYIPASGMLIFHVNENHYDWDNNCINCDPSYRGLYIKQAGGGMESNNSSQSLTPYPLSGNTSFTDTSIPNSKSWAGNNTNKTVTEIAHNTLNRTIYFKFMGGVDGDEREVTIESDPPLAGIISGGGTYYHGTMCDVTAFAQEGYRFFNWTADGEVISTGYSYSFTVEDHVTLVAHFKSSDPSLRDIVVSEGVLTPDFSPEIKNYTLNLCNANEVAITGTPTHPNAIVVGNGITSIPEGEALHRLVVTAEDEVSMRTYNIIINNALGINDEANNSLKIYPNPATNRVIIESSIPTCTPFQLIDLSGRVLMETLEKEIDISNFSSGIYILKSDNLRYKIVKK